MVRKGRLILVVPQFAEFALVWSVVRDVVFLCHSAMLDRKPVEQEVQLVRLGWEFQSSSLLAFADGYERWPLRAFRGALDAMANADDARFVLLGHGALLSLKNGWGGGQTS
ncbi:MAG: hypothetical protein Q8P01_03220 [bacterium]|nr:hypothetical protein [bacterium]